MKDHRENWTGKEGTIASKAFLQTGEICQFMLSCWPLSSTFSDSSTQVFERLTPLQTTFLFFSCYSDETPFLFFFLSCTRHASSVSFPPDISSIELGFDVNHQKPMPGLCLCVEWTPLLKMTHPVFLTVCSQSPTLVLWHELSPAALQQPSSGIFVGFMFGPWGLYFHTSYVIWPLIGITSSYVHLSERLYNR